MSGRGGAREGPGRPPLPPELKKIPVAYKLPRWMVEWLRAQDKTATRLIEDAVIAQYGLKPPTDQSGR